jgi:hypothetical protein
MMAASFPGPLDEARLAAVIPGTARPRSKFRGSGGSALARAGASSREEGLRRQPRSFVTPGNTAFTRSNVPIDSNMQFTRASNDCVERRLAGGPLKRKQLEFYRRNYRLRIGLLIGEDFLA